jgi:phosphatidylinositol kinase/protein kinase (PI-3  family)
MRGLLMPLDALGLQRIYMVKCMAPLRERKSVEAIGHLLEIFCNDPVIDWVT